MNENDRLLLRQMRLAVWELQMLNSKLSESFSPMRLTVDDKLATLEEWVDVSLASGT